MSSFASAEPVSQDSSVRPRPTSAVRRPAVTTAKPEQYAPTKSGFVTGRNVWSGTAERRASAAIAAASRQRLGSG